MQSQKTGARGMEHVWNICTSAMNITILSYGDLGNMLTQHTWKRGNVNDSRFLNNVLEYVSLVPASTCILRMLKRWFIQQSSLWYILLLFNCINHILSLRMVIDKKVSTSEYLNSNRCIIRQNMVRLIVTCIAFNLVYICLHRWTSRPTPQKCIILPDVRQV
jgi:hypothetical protein